MCRAQRTAEDGEIVVAGIPGEEATVKTLKRRNGRVVLQPANELLEPLEFEPGEVAVYGKVVTMMRRY